MMDQTVSPPSRRRGPLRNLLGVVAVLLQIFVVWLVAASGLVAPVWATVVFGAACATGLVPLVRGLRDRASWTPLVPLAVLVFLVVAVLLGDAFLGWTA